MVVVGSAGSPGCIVGSGTHPSGFVSFGVSKLGPERFVSADGACSDDCGSAGLGRTGECWFDGSDPAGV